MAAASTARPIAIDLFSGVGGLGLGLEQAGFHVAVAVELDEIHGRYAQYNHPTTTVLYGATRGDVRGLRPKQLRAHLPEGDADVTLVCGGPPCQGFSLAGKKNALDPLNDLVLELARLVVALRPKAFLIENVPGIERSNSPHLSTALRRLARYYRVADPEILRAPDFGVPQTRRRVFILGIRKDLKTQPTLPMATHRLPQAGGMRLPGLPSTPTAWEAIADIPPVDEYEELIDRDRVPYVAAPESDYARILRGQMRDPGDRSRPVAWDATVCTNLRRTRHGATMLDRFAELGFGEKDGTSGIGRIRPDALAPTIRAGTTKARGSWSAPRPLHPFQDRVLTTRECARIQSFPDWYYFHPAKWHGNMQVGNAVPPLLARAIGDHLLHLLGIRKPRRPRGTLQRDDDLIAADLEKAYNAGLSDRRVSQKVIHPQRASS